VPQGVPQEAKSFLTHRQEIDIYTNPKAEKYSLAEDVMLTPTSYLIGLYRGFYPDLAFHVEWDEIHINAYAFRLFGQNIIYISGGLLRLGALRFEGLAIILAQQVAYFYGADKTLHKDLLTQGEADYFGLGKVMRTAFYQNVWSEVAQAGYLQLAELFSYVSPQNAQGRENDANNPSLGCRLATIVSAIGAGSIPPCAGGNPAQSLRLMQATADHSKEQAVITLTFNRSIDSKYAADTSNYTFEPSLDTNSVTVNPNDDYQITLLPATIRDDIEYTVTVQNLKGVDGSTLSPRSVSAQFTATVK
jgi:hypothetical protein